MSDDIVTRLRACWCHDAFRDRGRVDPACDHDGVREEAADEIERLRTLAGALYADARACPTNHDVSATNAWELYEEALNV